MSTKRAPNVHQMSIVHCPPSPIVLAALRDVAPRGLSTHAEDEMWRYRTCSACHHVHVSPGCMVWQAGGDQTTSSEGDLGTQGRAQGSGHRAQGTGVTGRQLPRMQPDSYADLPELPPCGILPRPSRGSAASPRPTPRAHPQGPPPGPTTGASVSKALPIPSPH